MKHSQKINTLMYNLLIENEMNDFSIVEIRDAALKLDGDGQNPDDMRKIMYRQVRYFEKKGWLSCLGYGREKKYSKTDLFNSLSFVGKEPPSISIAEGYTPLAQKQNYSKLDIERKRFEGELEIKLSEIEQYKSLKKRFPEQKILLERLHYKASKQASEIRGSINAITNMRNLLLI